MREIEASPRGHPFTPGDECVSISGCELITDPSRVVLGGKTVAVYTRVPKPVLESLRGVGNTTKFSKNSRTSGLPTKSSVFGALPRNALRVDYCRMTRHSVEEPENYSKCFRFASFASELYKKELPEAYEAHLSATVGSVDEDWHHGHPFTTCNFNVNHAIKYHRDTGNMRGVFSNVVYLRQNVEGGRLVMPGLGLAFGCDDGAFVIFDGQSIIHGVTPLRRTKPDGYRTSIVLYTMAGMRHCYPFAQERDRFARVQTVRSSRRARNTGRQDGKTD